MSDIGKLRKAGGRNFPTVRKSSDPFQPEQGEMDFSQDLEEFQVSQSTSVSETEKAEQGIIHDENRRKQYRKRKKKKKEEEENEIPRDEYEEPLIDLKA